MSRNEHALSRIIPPPTILGLRDKTLANLIRMQMELAGGAQ